MTSLHILRRIFIDNHRWIVEAIKGLTHAESIQTPPFGGCTIHWTAGHILVARCNFMLHLGLPSLWDFAICKFFIPGTLPSDQAAHQVPFDRILTDFETSQVQLLHALERSSPADLENDVDDRTLGDALAEYAAHEAYHAGQLALLRRALANV